jgi:hypothetical protein
MARPKSNGPYAPLSATYFLDDAILEAGEQAELLFVRCLAFLANSSSDGFISEIQMNTIVGLRMRNVGRRVASLVQVGVLESVAGGYLMRSWLKWNKSTDEIGKHLRQDRARKQAAKGPNSVWNDDGIQPDSSDQITTNHYKSNQITPIESARIRAELESEFEDGWNHWPKKVERKAAHDKYMIAAKKIGWDVLLDAVIRFGDAYAATTEKQFVPALGVWLSHERWTDELPVRRAPATRTSENLSTVAQYAQLEQIGIEA